MLCGAVRASAAEFEHIRCLHQISCGGFDVVLVIGQSNATSRAINARPLLKRPNDRIWQLGRDKVNNYVLPAREPLMHLSASATGMGFALPFARLYRDEILENKRDVLIIPAANGATSVARTGSYWRPGGPGEKDVRARLASTLHEYRDARLVAILWHQGESDIGSDQVLYRRLTAQLLTGIRDEFGPSAPIILGELAESFRANLDNEDVNQSIHAIAKAIPNAGLALSTSLRTIGENSLSASDATHFNAAAQLEFGKRYFCAFVRLADAGNDLARHPYCERFSLVSSASCVGPKRWSVGIRNLLACFWRPTGDVAENVLPDPQDSSGADGR